MTKTNEMVDNAVNTQESPVTSGGIRRPPEKKHRKSNKRKRIKEVTALKGQVNCSSISDEDDEKVEVEKKIVALQQIVPGGESLDNIDNLFDETAGYILELQNQVKAMKVIVDFFELLQKQKTKLGG